jgi:hypothetical protein
MIKLARHLSKTPGAVQVLHQGLFLQDRNCDLRERYTAGDRYEPLGSDGLWTNVDHRPLIARPD